MISGTSAIKYALTLEASEGWVFLTAWSEGNFDIIRKFWPTCPKEALDVMEEQPAAVHFIKNVTHKPITKSDAATCDKCKESILLPSLESA